MSFRLGGLASVVGLCAAVLAWSPEADACGGFFCQRVPVDQSGEHLLFGIEDDGTVVAHIQIQYQGAAESFAWVLPLPAEPDLDVGSDEIFRTLRALTNPTFQVDWTYEGECMFPDYGADSDADADTDSDSDGDVTVLQQGPVGPYDTAVIQSADAEALLVWLGDNDYDIPDVSVPEIQSYVNGGYVFLALRLQKDRPVGDLAPIVVRFPEIGPCIPLRLTAIAAMADMPIYAWVLAEGRAISTNFLDVVPNWAAIDWINYGWNYEDVVRRAVDEATGHAFVTEYAGPSAILGQAFWWEGRYDVDALRGLDDPIQFVDELIAQGFSGNSQLLELLRRFIPKPAELEDVDDQSFYNCLSCYDYALEGLVFDAEQFADAIQQTIVDPLVAAQEMAGRHPYLTRIHTTISPEEMTEDPIFRFNLDLGDVSNVHVAEGTMFCGDDMSAGNDLVQLTLPDGRVIFVTGDGPRPSTDEDMPASGSASQMGEVGEGTLQYDNSDAIDGILEERYGPPPGTFDDGGDIDGDGVPDGAMVGGGGCSIGRRGAGAALPFVLAAVPFLWRRRRSR